MNICSLTIRHKGALKKKVVDLGKNTTIFHSRQNETGKTTLVRAILYTLGFTIPNTELIKFKEYEFSSVVIRNGETFNIERKDQLLTINGNEYDLPTEQVSAHILLFDTGNNEIISNILGTIYFDQEKGWTLLNRGFIIGGNRFNIESFFRGLKGDESDDSYRIIARMNALDKKIAQYKLMFRVSEYQESINRDVEKNYNYKTYEQKIDEELLAIKIRLQKIEDEISTISEIMRKNKNFSDYISAKQIFVQNPIDGAPIRVTRETLYKYIDTDEINSVRKGRLITERNKLKSEIFKREHAQTREEALLDLTNVDEELSRKFSTIQNFSSVQVKILLDKFQNEKNVFSNKLKNRTKQDNIWINDAIKIISNYAEELSMPDGYKIDVFNKNLKGISGAILHKMVFIYKLAYIKLLSRKLDYHLPIFLDSPSGREVERFTIDEMLKIIKRDFSEHQIIIASIFDYNNIFTNATLISMDKTLFDAITLFD